MVLTLNVAGANRQNEHFGYRQKGGSPTPAPLVPHGSGAAFKACNRRSQPAIWFQLAKFRLTMFSAVLASVLA